MRKPRRARRGSSNWFNGAVAAVLIVGVALVLQSRGATSSAGNVGPKMDGAGGRPDHWHAALGVYVCDKWEISPPWPQANNATNSRGRAGNTSIYAGLHTHELADGSGDGIVHMEPSSSEDAGRNSTLGRYLKYGGWSMNQTSMKLWVGSDGKKIEKKNGQKCGNKKAELRYAIGQQEAGKTAKLIEQTGNPAKLKLNSETIVAVYFVPADAKLDKLGDVPSIKNLTGASEREGATETPTTAPASPTVPGVTTTSIPGGTTVPNATGTTVPNATSTSAPEATNTSAPAASTTTTTK